MHLGRVHSPESCKKDAFIPPTAFVWNPSPSRVTAQGLSRSTSVRRLDLSSNLSLGNGAVRALSGLLDCRAIHLRLTVLRFQANNALRHHQPSRGFHHSSLKELARQLQTNTSLTELYLSNTTLTPKSAVALAAALSANSTLQVLDLSSNRFGDEGGVAIAQALSQPGCQLRHLDLTATRISAITAVALGQALRVNRSLETLHLGENRLVQLPEPQVLSNCVYDERDDLMVDPNPEQAGDEDDTGEEGESHGWVPSGLPVARPLADSELLFSSTADSGVSPEVFQQVSPPGCLSVRSLLSFFAMTSGWACSAPFP